MTEVEKLCKRIKEADDKAFDYSFDAHLCHRVGDPEEAKVSEDKAEAWNKQADDLRRELANLLIYAS